MPGLGTTLHKTYHLLINNKMQLLTIVRKRGVRQPPDPCAQAQLEKAVSLERIPLLHVQWTK